MKQLAIYSLLVIMIGLTGCPVLTINSADDGSYEVGTWMRGWWHEVNDLGKPEESWLVERDLKKGNLTCYEGDTATGRAKMSKPHHMIMSTVAGKVFLFAHNEGDDGSDEGYYVFEFRKVSNKEFVLAGIKHDKIPYVATRVEINKYLKENANNPTIYDLHETSTFRKF